MTVKEFSDFISLIPTQLGIIPIKKNQYQCAKCGGIFTKTSTEEEMQAEAKANGFDKFPPKTLCLVCEDCYKKIMSLKSCGKKFI